ncbi:MAG TPA: FHA domain-containing protein [Anaerolineaceae bacterium]|nr:FHA domain-containing protein [Anaerolineaceae bacterium]
MNPLDQIERRIRSLFEASYAFTLWPDQNAHLIHQICEAMQGFFEAPFQEEVSAPEFILYMNPITASEWKQKEDWQKLLAEAIRTSSAELGVHFSTPPKFTLITRNSIEASDVKVEIAEVRVPTDHTGAIGLNALKPGLANHARPASGAFLIDPTEKCIALHLPVTNLGRRSNNSIVINDMRVSRSHAQIRMIQGEHVIFDTGSTGGTFVNGNRIEHHTLRPGDVISLAGYTFIYTVELNDDSREAREKTSEFKPGTGKEQN